MKMLTSAFLCLTLLTGCSREEKSDAIAGLEEYALTPSEQVDLKQRADQGDKDAAYSLARFYGLIKYDKDQELFWMSRAASLKHPAAQYNVGFHYLHKVHPPDLEKAKKWLAEARENGLVEAERPLKEIAEIEAKNNKRGEESENIQ